MVYLEVFNNSRRKAKDDDVRKERERSEECSGI
jgi:hypothetical protein